MTLSDKKISPGWQSNELLTSDKVSAGFTALSWSNGGDSVEFTKWEAPNIKVLDAVKKVAAATASSELPEELIETANKDEPEEQTVSLAVFDQAKQDSFEMGYSRGLEEAERKWEHTRETFSALTQSIYQEQQKATTFFEPLKTLSLHIAQQLVRGELRLSSAAIERLIRGLLEDIQQKGLAPIVMTLNPQDLDQVCSSLPGDLAHLDLRKSDNLSRGSVSLMLDNSTIEDLIEHRLEALSESLFAAVSDNNVSGSRSKKELSKKGKSENQQQGTDSQLVSDSQKSVDEAGDV